jgi:hypothetical protein
MRRLLGDLGHDIETSVFTIIDIYYKPVLNTKGLIQSDTTMAAIRPKVAYYAIQNLAAIFDNNMVLETAFKYSTRNKASLSVYGYKHKTNKSGLVALWVDSANVSNSFATTPVTITIENAHFKEPVYVDLMTGAIYEIPGRQWSRKENRYTFSNLPVYDAPVLIADRSLLKIEKQIVYLTKPD